jgi:hypothetical protein
VPHNVAAASGCEPGELSSLTVTLQALRLQLTDFRSPAA